MFLIFFKELDEKKKKITDYFFCFRNSLYIFSNIFIFFIFECEDKNKIKTKTTTNIIYFFLEPFFVFVFYEIKKKEEYK